MAIDIQCSDCSKKFTTKEAAAGKRVKCPACGALVLVPATGAKDESPPTGTAPAIPSIVPMLLLMGLMLVAFGVFTMFAGLGHTPIVTGPIAVVCLIGVCIAGSRVQRHVIRMYPIRAQAMFGAHLRADDGELAWVYCMNGPSALVNLLMPFNNLSRSFLLGMTDRRFLVIATTDRLAGELAFVSIAFTDIKRAWIEDCSDPYGLGFLAAKPGLTLHLELQDGSSLALSSSYDFPAYPAHRQNLEKIAAFLGSKRFQNQPQTHEGDPATT